MTWGRTSDVRERGEARRQAILDVLRTAPGASFREITRRTGIPSGSVAHHLRILGRRHQVWDARDGMRIRYWAGAEPPLDVQARLIREAGITPELAAIRHAIALHGPMDQGTILDLFPASRATTQHRLGQLVARGALRSAWMGRRRMYWLPEQPSPFPWAAPPPIGAPAAPVSAPRVAAVA